MFFRTRLNFKVGMGSWRGDCIHPSLDLTCGSCYLEEMPKASTCPSAYSGGDGGHCFLTPTFVGKEKAALPPPSACTLMRRQCPRPGPGLPAGMGTPATSFNLLLPLLIGGSVARGLGESGTSFGLCLLLGKIPASLRQCPGPVFILSLSPSSWDRPFVPSAPGN